QAVALVRQQAAGRRIDRVLGVFRLGVADRQVDLQGAGRHPAGLEVEAFGDRLAYIRRVLDAADRDIDRLLDVVPFHVIGAGRNRQSAVQEFVLGADLI